MTRNALNAFLYVGLVAPAAILAGCASKNVDDMEFYILEATRNAQPIQLASGGALEVNRFSVAAGFAAKNLIYRVGRFAYEADPYREFLIAPGSMITERARRWLTRSGLFAQVLPPGSRVEPTHTLDGSVTALYGDFRDKSAAKAVVEIRFFLLGGGAGSETVLFAETYRSAAPVAAQSPTALVAALNQGLIEILERLEGDLQRVLHAGAP